MSDGPRRRVSTTSFVAVPGKDPEAIALVDLIRADLEARFARLASGKVADEVLATLARAAATHAVAHMWGRGWRIRQ